MQDVAREAGSRAATDALLGGLRAGRWGVRAWGLLLDRATRRSVRQAAARPRALAEVTLLHLAVGVLAGRRGRAWAATSWGLAATHLGMLEGRRSLGLPNVLTLLRATLPAVAPRLGGALPVLALATDLADGKLARATGTRTRFGEHADFLTDTAVWTWFVLHREPGRWVRAATIGAWAVPVVAVTATSVARGRMVDVPRSRWLRPAAAMEVVLGVRALARALRGPSAPPAGPGTVTARRSPAR